MDLDFQELSNDADLIGRIKQFHEASDKIKEVLTLASDHDFYDNLSNENKIKFNMLMSFGLNSLFWMYLRTEGVDPNTHKIKSENDRLRKTMARSQMIKDKKTKMPKLNKDVAKRFVRSGLWEATNRPRPSAGCEDSGKADQSDSRQPNTSEKTTD